MNKDPNKNVISDDEEKDKFYDELDEKASHKSCCTCQTLLIFFICLLFISTGVIFYLYWQIKKGDIFNSLPHINISKDYQAKLDKPEVDTNGDFQLTLTSDDLTGLLSEGVSTENFVLKDINVSVNPSNVLVYGTLIKPISSKVVITAVPKVENGKIKFNVTNISAGDINLPAVFNNSISGSLSGLFDKKLATFYENYEVQKVVLENNQIFLVGKSRR